jgi:hypothetical protein
VSSVALIGLRPAPTRFPPCCGALTIFHRFEKLYRFQVDGTLEFFIIESTAADKAKTKTPVIVEATAGANKKPANRQNPA